MMLVQNNRSHMIVLWSLGWSLWSFLFLKQINKVAYVFSVNVGQQKDIVDAVYIVLSTLS